jgi:hypothetical protein
MPTTLQIQLKNKIPFIFRISRFCTTHAMHQVLFLLCKHGNDGFVKAAAGTELFFALAPRVLKRQKATI